IPPRIRCAGSWPGVVSTPRSARAPTLRNTHRRSTLILLSLVTQMRGRGFLTQVACQTLSSASGSGRRAERQSEGVSLGSLLANRTSSVPALRGRCLTHITATTGCSPPGSRFQADAVVWHLPCFALYREEKCSWKEVGPAHRCLRSSQDPDA